VAEQHVFARFSPQLMCLLAWGAVGARAALGDLAAGEGGTGEWSCGHGGSGGSSSTDLAAGGLHSKARVCRAAVLGAGMLRAKAPTSRSGNSQRVQVKLQRSGIWEKSQSQE